MKTQPSPPAIQMTSSPEGQAAEISDRDLMTALQHGDATALEFLYRRYRELFRAVILRIVHDHATAEDVLQECLVEIWRSSSHFCSAKGEPLGWLVTLCKRRAIDNLRRNTAYCNARNRLEVEVSSKPTEFGAGQDCENADIAQLVRQHLGQLPEAQRQAVVLAFMEGMSQREVAKATHTPLGTVKTRLELGLQKLRVAFRVNGAMHSMQTV